MTFHASLLVRWICWWWLSSSHLSITYNTKQLADKGVGYHAINKDYANYTQSSTLFSMGVSERLLQGQEDQYPVLGSSSLKGILEHRCLSRRGIRGHCSTSCTGRALNVTHLLEL